MELTKASSHSMQSSYSSECDCYLCQYGTGCQHVEPYPFYPTMGNPLVYFAQTTNGKNRDGKKPNAFVRAFRWYTEAQQPNSVVEPRNQNQEAHTHDKEASILNQEKRELCVETCRSVCRSTDDRMNMPGFARWLDDKYEQFLLENSDATYVCDPNQCALTETLDPGTETQPQSEMCQPSCPKKNRFPRLKSPWKKRREQCKSMDRGCLKECGGYREGERQQGSMEYILPPNNVSRAASVCCYPTPSSCYSVLVKSQSMTSFNKDCSYNQEVEIKKPVVVDNPPVEQKFANSGGSNVTKETKLIEKKAICINISCQCCLHAISKDAQTQYETIKASNKPTGPNTPFSSTSNAPDLPPQQKKQKHCSKKKRLKGDASKKNLDSSNISTTSTQTKSNISSPYSTGLRQDAHSQYEQPEDRDRDRPFYNAPCPSIQKSIPNQRELCSNLQEPCPGRRPCPTLHRRCPKYNEKNYSCREPVLHVRNHDSHLRKSKYDDSHEITETDCETNRNVCSPCLRQDCSDHCRANPKLAAATMLQKTTLNTSELTTNVSKPRCNLVEECFKFNETKSKSKITTTCCELDSFVYNSCPSPYQKCSDKCTISNRDTNSICRGPIPKVGERRLNTCIQRLNINQETSIIGEPSPNVCKPCPSLRKECSKFNETTSKPKSSTTPRISGSYLYNPCPSLREECSDQCTVSPKCDARPQPGPIISVENSNVCKPCPSIRKECLNYKETSPNGDVKTVPNIPMERFCKPSCNMRKPSSINCEPRSNIPEQTSNFCSPTSCYCEAVSNCRGPTPNLGQAYPSFYNARFDCYHICEACPDYREVCSTQVQCPGRFEACLGCCCPNCGVFHESNINNKPNEAETQHYYYPPPPPPQQNTVIMMPPPVVVKQKPVGKCSDDCAYYKSKLEAQQTTTNNQATEAVSEQVTVDAVQTSNNCIRLDTINKYPFFMKIVCADRLINEKNSE